MAVILQAAMFVTIAVGRVEAQRVLKLGEGRACDDCTVRIERVVTLGEAEGEGYVGYPTGFGRLRNGDWILVHPENSTQITLFTPDGRFRRRHGRPGGGPDEYSWITFLQAGAGDSVRVYDAGLGRLSVLDSNLHAKRWVQLGTKGPYSVMFNPDGSFVAAVEVSDIERLGFPLHLFASDGQVLRSFGALRPEYRSDQPRALIRSLAPAALGRVWSGHFLEYTVELWDFDGELITKYTRDVEWFKPHNHYGYNGTKPPNPALISLYQDTAGHLWTLVRVADATWQRGVGTLAGPRSSGLGVKDRAAYYDTIVEVFDVRTGGLLATRRLPDYLVRFDPQGYVVGYREDEAGYPYVDVYRMHLQPGGRAR